MNRELHLLEIPMNNLVLRSTAQTHQIFWILRFRSIEGQRHKFASLDFCWGERFLLIGLEIHEEDDRHLRCLLTPCKISFVVRLRNCGYPLRARQSGDEGLCLFVLEGGGEGIEYDGVGCGEDESVFAMGWGVEEETVLNLSVVVWDVFLDDCVFKWGDRLLDFHSICNLL